MQTVHALRVLTRRSPCAQGAAFVPPDPAAFRTVGNSAHSTAFSFAAPGHSVQSYIATTLQLLGRDEEARPAPFAPRSVLASSLNATGHFRVTLSLQ